MQAQRVEIKGKVKSLGLDVRSMITRACSFCSQLTGLSKCFEVGVFIVEVSSHFPCYTKLGLKNQRKIPAE